MYFLLLETLDWMKQKLLLLRQKLARTFYNLNGFNFNKFTDAIMSRLTDRVGEQMNGLDWSCQWTVAQNARKSRTQIHGIVTTFPCKWKKKICWCAIHICVLHTRQINRYLYLMFFSLLLSVLVFFFFSLLLCWRCLLPTDSSMFLSVTECNWFCQGQSIAPQQASSAGDRGSITVKLCAAYRNNTVYLCVQVFWRKWSWCDWSGVI